MALTGTFEKKAIRTSATETEQLIQPDGTTTTVPAAEEYVSDTYTDCYVRIVNVNVGRRSNNDLKLDVNYYIYENEEKANSGSLETNLLHHDLVPLMEINVSESQGNLFSHAYSKIKQIDAFQGFTDV